MKLQVFCLFLILLVISGCISCVNLVTKITETASQYLEKAMTYQQMGDTITAAKLIKQSEDIWSQYEAVLGIVLSHDEVDEIIAEYARLQSHTTTGDTDDLQSTCAVLIVMLKHIREIQYPTVSNIL